MAFNFQSLMDFLFGTGEGNGGGGTGLITDPGQSFGPTQVPGSGGDIIPLPTGPRHEILVLEPETTEDAKNLIEQLISRRSLMVNLHRMSREDAQRMVDILGGAIQALRGDMKAITNNVFVVSPSTVQLTTPPMGQQTYNQHDFKANAREYAYAG